MAVSTRALTTRLRLTAFLGLSGLSASQNTVLDNIIDACTDWVEAYCRRKMKRTAYDYEYYDGTDSQRLLLRHYPIDTSQTFNLSRRTTGDATSSWTTVTSTDYFIYEYEGVLEFPTVRYGAQGRKFITGNKRYRVEYTAGFYLPQDASYTQGDPLSLPVDLEYAVWKLCAIAWENRRGGSNVTSERLGAYAVTFAKESFEDEKITDVLNKYSRQEFGTYSTYVA